MKYLILLILSSLPIAVSAQDDIDLINKAANQACTGNPQKESCKEMVVAVAKFSMIQTGMYAQSCLKNVSEKDKELCADLGRFITYLGESGK